MTAPELPEPGLTPEGQAYMQRCRDEAARQDTARKVPHEGEWALEDKTRWGPTVEDVSKMHFTIGGRLVTNHEELMRAMNPPIRPRSWWRNIVNAHKLGEWDAERKAVMRAGMDEMHRLGVRDGWAMRGSMPERGALLGHMICALSGAIVGLVVGLLL